MSAVRCLPMERGYDLIGSAPEQYAENMRSEMAKRESVVKTTLACLT